GGVFDLERGGSRRRVAGEAIRLAAGPGAPTVLRPAPGHAIVLTAAAATRRGRPSEATTRAVRGPVTLRSEQGRLVAVARVPLDDYAAAVAEAELRTFDAPAEALVAQAVVARTYALAHRDRHAAEGADMCDLTHCQLYTGDHSRNVAQRRALGAAAGLVLEYGDEPAETLYHAACGGQLLANDAVFGGASVPYLQGGHDPACAGERAAGSWQARLDAAAVSRAVLAVAPEVGTVRELHARRRPAGGAPADVEIVGAKGSRTVTAYQLWRALGAEAGWNAVRSVRFHMVPAETGFGFVGRGLGHGVGLCQAGALQRARRGATHAEILRAYYPGTELRRLAARPAVAAAGEAP
ncbi:MAG: SpoIID/LytB domain-containing protein, partial [Candidatus Sericytochromatia bacterium]|nr:SpoIID/LytB domain-containing protein [Candidatus Tanganyikabacteria bacterium]